MEEQRDRAPAATAMIKIVEMMAQAGTPVTLAQISGKTGINKNMISRILSSLLEAGWVVMRDGTGEYFLSLQLFCLGSAALEHTTLTRCAEPYLKRMNDLTGECIQLAVLYDGQAVYVAQMDAKGDAGVRGRIGAGYSLDVTAPGKALKAFVRKDASMGETRARGYAVDNEEYGRGVICIAAPVYNYTGEAVAALGISSLTVNYTMEELESRYAPILVAESGKLSRELGYRADPSADESNGEKQDL